MAGSKVKSERRSAAMKTRWADPAFAERARANLAAGRLPKAPRPQAAPDPAAPPPKEGDAAASGPFSGRALFGRRRSSSS
jgi:hypothetical protein